MMFDIYPEYTDLMNITETAMILNCKPSTVCRLWRLRLGDRGVYHNTVFVILQLKIQ